MKEQPMYSQEGGLTVKDCNFEVCDARVGVSIRQLRNSAIAQLVEQVTVNHLVPGSSPGRGAI